MALYPEFASLLNKHLQEGDRTLSWLARRLSISHSTVSRWLSQETRPADPETIVRIADILGIHKPADRQKLLIAAGYGYLEGPAADPPPAPSFDPAYEADGGAAPPDRSMLKPTRNRHNLPLQTTSFFGREDELADIRRLLLETSECRLVTLIGPGGVGKTRLALAGAAQALESFTDGVYFVSLAPVAQVSDIIPAIAEALHFAFYSSSEPKEQLLDYLSQKQLLLVVDNFEHLLNGVDLLADILRQAPQVTLLATSRERLDLQEEWGYEVQGLQFPARGRVDITPELESYSSMQLFLQRSKRALASFTPSAEDMADIVRICQRVEGMPLALELAAPWIRTLSCREIAEEIETNLDLLTTTLRNVPERHRSLRVVFDQTWGRLSEAERAVLQQLSVFRGGCTREAAEKVTGATLQVLSSLVDKGLIRRTELARYELHELIRQFAEMQLRADPNAVEKTQRRHQEYFITFLETRTADVKGKRQKDSLAEIKVDMDNVRLSWRGAVANQDATAFERAAECLFVFYLYSSGHYEGQIAFRQAAAAFMPDSVMMDSGPSDKPAALEGQENLTGFLLACQGYFLGRTRDPFAGQTLLEQAVDLLRSGEAPDRHREGFGLQWLAWMYLLQGRTPTALEYVEPTLAILNESADPLLEGWCLLLWANALTDISPPEAEDIYKRCLTVCSNSGDLNLFGYASQMRSGVNMTLGRYTQARRLIDEALKTFEEVDNVLGLGYTLQQRGKLSVFLGEYRQAIPTLQQALAHFAEARTEQNITATQIVLGTAYRLQHEYDLAESLFQQALEASTARDHHGEMIDCLAGLGVLAHDRGDLVKAEQFHREALAVSRRVKLETRESQVLCYLGQTMAVVGRERHGEARRYFLQALELAVKRQVTPLALEICAGLARLQAHTEELARAVEIATLAVQHDASTFETKESARQLLAEVEAKLSPSEVQSAQTRGQQLDWQQTAQDLMEEFRQGTHEIDPRPIHPDGIRSNLPPQSTPFIGRENELTDISRLLAHESDCRLVTLVGPGGMGKTRLALASGEAQIRVDRVLAETAVGQNPVQTHRFADGVYFVGLAALRTVDEIPMAVADAVGYSIDTGEQTRALKERLVSYLRSKRMLLILDNFEHLLEGAPLAAEILEHAPGVKILVTSRERLHLTSEHIYTLHGLEFTDWTALEEIADNTATQLFVQGARRMRSDFELQPDDLPDLVRICRLVGGMPLALTLASGWVDVLPLAGIADEIQKGLGFLETDIRDVPARQRSMRATIDSSWQLLLPIEQSVLAQLSVFQTGFSREAAAEVAGSSLRTLAGLVAKSLLYLEPSREVYELHELVRQYARDRLQDDLESESATLLRHSRCHATLLHEQMTRADARSYLAQVEEIFDDVQAAWRYAVENCLLDRIQQMAQGFLAYYRWHSWYRAGSDALALYQQALTCTDPDTQDPTRQATRACLYESIGDLQKMNTLYMDAMAAYSRALDADPNNDFIRRGRLYGKIADVWVLMNRHESGHENYTLAESTLELSPERTADWWHEWLRIRIQRMELYYWQNLPDAMARIAREIEPALEHQGSATQRVHFLNLLGMMSLRRDRYYCSSDAIDYTGQALSLSQKTVNLGDIAARHFYHGFSHLWSNHLAEAETHLQTAAEMAEENGDLTLLARALTYLILVYRRREDMDRCREYAGHSLRIAAHANMPQYTGMAHAHLAWLAWRSGDLSETRRRAEAAIADWGGLGQAQTLVVVRWFALFPLLGVALHVEAYEDAVQYAKYMITLPQQRLPDDLTSALEEAIAAAENGYTDVTRQLLQTAYQLAHELHYV